MAGFSSDAHTSRILLPKLQSLVNNMKLKEPLDGWRRNCKRWRCNKLDHLLQFMMSIIDLQQELLPMILAVKMSIGEGELHPKFMDKDIITKGKELTTAIDVNVTTRTHDS